MLQAREVALLHLIVLVFDEHLSEVCRRVEHLCLHKLLNLSWRHELVKFD